MATLRGHNGDSQEYIPTMKKQRRWGQRVIFFSHFCTWLNRSNQDRVQNKNPKFYLLNVI